MTEAATENHHLLSTLGTGLATKPDTEAANLRGHVMIKNRTGGRPESAIGVPASAERPRPRSHSVADGPALGWV
jgi:hypothetical protein